jgi:hypothetical protein
VPEAPVPPELDLDGLGDDGLDGEGEGRALVRVEGRAGHAERLLPEAFAALEAGALVVWLPPPPGWPRRLRVRLYRYSGPAWYRGEWVGRGEWYVGFHVPASVPWSGRRTVNLYLGTWRAPGVRSRAANARTAPPPLSPEGVRRAVRLVRDRLARG